MNLNIMNIRYVYLQVLINLFEIVLLGRVLVIVDNDRNIVFWGLLLDGIQFINIGVLIMFFEFEELVLYVDWSVDVFLSIVGMLYYYGIMLFFVWLVDIILDVGVLLLQVDLVLFVILNKIEFGYFGFNKIGF